MSSLENIYVVVANGISDIGKGWLTAALCGLNLAHTVPIKIDPLLNLGFPKHLGVPVSEVCNPADIAAFVQQRHVLGSDFKVSDDMATYHEAGACVYPECNIVAGDLINRFLNSPNVEIRPGEVKKRTFTDLSRFLAAEITEIVKVRQPATLIIEVGGTIEDAESTYIPSAMRFLGQREYLGVYPQIILLTFLEYAESWDTDKYRVKTQYIRRGVIQASQRYYHLAIKACFVRQRNIPSAVEDTVLLRDLRNAAYETQIAPEKIVYLPNVSRPTVRDNLSEITAIIRQTGLFA